MLLTGVIFVYFDYELLKKVDVKRSGNCQPKPFYAPSVNEMTSQNI